MQLFCLLNRAIKAYGYIQRRFRIVALHVNYNWLKNAFYSLSTFRRQNIKDLAPKAKRDQLIRSRSIRYFSGFALEKLLSEGKEEVGGYKDQHNLHIYYCRDWHQSKAPKEKGFHGKRNMSKKNVKCQLK